MRIYANSKLLYSLSVIADIFCALINNSFTCADKSIELPGDTLSQAALCYWVISRFRAKLLTNAHQVMR